MSDRLKYGLFGILLGAMGLGAGERIYFKYLYKTYDLTKEKADQLTKRQCDALSEVKDVIMLTDEVKQLCGFS
jgi:hypothetical protein